MRIKYRFFIIQEQYFNSSGRSLSLLSLPRQLSENNLSAVTIFLTAYFVQPGGEEINLSNMFMMQSVYKYSFNECIFSLLHTRIRCCSSLTAGTLDGKIK